MLYNISVKKMQKSDFKIKIFFYICTSASMKRGLIQL